MMAQPSFSPLRISQNTFLHTFQVPSLQGAHQTCNLDRISAGIAGNTASLGHTRRSLVRGNGEGNSGAVFGQNQGPISVRFRVGFTSPSVEGYSLLGVQTATLPESGLDSALVSVEVTRTVPTSVTIPPMSIVDVIFSLSVREEITTPRKGSK